MVIREEPDPGNAENRVGDGPSVDVPLGRQQFQIKELGFGG